MRIAGEKLDFFGQRLAGYRRDQPAYSLSYANRRRLEIARAMATEPKLLLLDEPAAGMNPVETHEITELISELRERGGYTILVIEHDMHVVEGISDRVIALDHGVKIAEGSFDEVATDARVVEAYLGLKASMMNAHSSSLDDIHTYYGGDPHPRQRISTCRRASSSVPRRQRVRQVDDAEDDPRHRRTAKRRRPLRRGGGDRAHDEPPHPARDGDRPGEPAPLRTDVRAREPRDGRVPVQRGQQGRFERVFALPAALRTRSQLAGTLSGGEQQMVAMGRALMARPKLLLMDEPSMGLAPILVERSFEIIKSVHEPASRSSSSSRTRTCRCRSPTGGTFCRPDASCSRGRRGICAERGVEEGLPGPLSVRTRCRRGAAPLPDLREARLRQLVLAGRALRRRARLVRAVPPRLGRVRRAVGVLGRADGSRALGVREADQRRARGDRGHDVALGRRRSARERTALRRARGTRSCSPTGSSRRSARSGTRRSRAARESSMCTRPRTGRSRRVTSAA